MQHNLNLSLTSEKWMFILSPKGLKYQNMNSLVLQLPYHNLKWYIYEEYSWNNIQ